MLTTSPHAQQCCSELLEESIATYPEPLELLHHLEDFFFWGQDIAALGILAIWLWPVGVAQRWFPGHTVVLWLVVLNVVLETRKKGNETYQCTQQTSLKSCLYNYLCTLVVGLLGRHLPLTSTWHNHNAISLPVLFYLIWLIWTENDLCCLLKGKAVLLFCTTDFCGDPGFPGSCTVTVVEPFLHLLLFVKNLKHVILSASAL